MSGYGCPSFNNFFFSFLTFSVNLSSYASGERGLMHFIRTEAVPFIASLLHNYDPLPEVSWKLKYEMRNWIESRNTIVISAV
jgi:hypothetical protein